MSLHKETMPGTSGVPEGSEIYYNRIAGRILCFDVKTKAFEERCARSLHCLRQWLNLCSERDNCQPERDRASAGLSPGKRNIRGNVR